MCFSAEASFVASAGLGVAGLVALKANKNQNQVFLALIPIIFSVQQLAEGFLWLSSSNQYFTNWQLPATYIFLFFALILWPLWIPLSVWYSEIELKRKKALLLLILAGLVVAVLMAILLLFFPVQAEVGHHHIHYQFDIEKQLSRRFSFLYFIPAIIPPFVSGNKKVRIFGWCLLVSYAVAAWRFPGFFVSVYCYFAAVLSVIIIWIVASPANENRPKTLRD